jgi:hypothetical protein
VAAMVVVEPTPKLTEIQELTVPVAVAEEEEMTILQAAAETVL